MTIKLMTQATKDQIADLERQKIMLEEEKLFHKSPTEIALIDEKLYEIKDTLAKLTA